EDDSVGREGARPGNRGIFSGVRIAQNEARERGVLADLIPDFLQRGWDASREVNVGHTHIRPAHGGLKPPNRLGVLRRERAPVIDDELVLRRRPVFQRVAKDRNAACGRVGEQNQRGEYGEAEAEHSATSAAVAGKAVSLTLHGSPARSTRGRPSVRVLGMRIVMVGSKAAGSGSAEYVTPLTQEGRSEFAQGGRLDLPYPFLGESELLSDLLEGLHVRTVRDEVPSANDHLLAARQQRVVRPQVLVDAGEARRDWLGLVLLTRLPVRQDFQ